MSEMALELIWRAKAERWKRLDLGNCGIVGAVPDEVGELEDLEELILSDEWDEWEGSRWVEKFSQNKGQQNEINDLPASLPLKITHFVAQRTKILDITRLAPLSALKVLLLPSTNVSDISPLQGLVQLEVLRLYNTQVVDISPLKGLAQLQMLSLQSIKVVDITPLQGLTQLHALWLGYTQVVDISPLQGLVQLQKLNLNRTQVADIGPLQGLSQVKTLNLIETKVVDIRPLEEIIRAGVEVKLKLDSDEGIFVEGCPLTNPPIEIIKQGREAILTYWDSLAAEEGPLPLNEAKVIFIGEGASGKTSILKRLFKEGFSPDQHQTNGILIRKENYVLKDEKVLVRFWDFGGQEIMHATHRFFLTNRALYVIVLDARKDDQQVEYWLEHVRVYGGDSKVVIVINKIDENPSFAINEKGLREKFGNRIQTIHRVSCLSNQGIENLESTLLNLIEQADSTHTPMPKAWRLVKDDVEAITADFMGYEGYRAICLKHGLADEDTQMILLRLLNDLGIALNFEALKEQDTAVLNPEWLTNAVYRVINADRTARQLGEFAIDEIGALLDDAKYKEKADALRYPAEKYGFIAEAMAAFELCYRLPEAASKRYLIPELLPVEENAGTFSEAGSTQLELHYESFLPPSILPRFIVQMNPWVLKGRAWRTGVCLQHEAWKTGAILRLDRQDRRIRIGVVGADRRRLMEFIRDTFRLLHAEFKGLRVFEYVPLDGGGDFAEYDGLVGLLEMGVADYPSGRLRKQFPIAALLNGLEEEGRRSIAPLEPVRIFVSYSHKHPEHKANLLTHLSVYSRAGKVTVWDDGRLVAGQVWKEELWNRHAAADIVLCLISAAFFESDYCFAMEFVEACKAMEDGKKDVIPILVEPCHWGVVEEVARLQVIPSKRAVGLYRNENQAWNEVMEALGPVIEKWILRRSGK